MPAAAGSRTVFHNADAEVSLADVANIADTASQLPWASDKSDGHRRTAPVGAFRSNAFGLCDMHGNVYEWCEGPHFSYANVALADSTRRVTRGGSWESQPMMARSALRLPKPPDWRCRRHRLSRGLGAPRLAEPRTLNRLLGRLGRPRSDGHDWRGIRDRSSGRRGNWSRGRQRLQGKKATDATKEEAEQGDGSGQGIAHDLASEGVRSSRYSLAIAKDWLRAFGASFGEKQLVRDK